MSYQAFLIALGQMASNKKARIIVENHFIIIDESPEGWNFSTIVFQGDGQLPSEIRSCVSPSGSLHTQDSGFHLKMDATGNALTLHHQAVLQKGKYIPFRHHLQLFVSAAAEWKEVLLNLAMQRS